ncbi:zntD [Symbiodinium natans]|uniref:ZntD protein n=1 Tax=Symbiodinium natans TaxID=878477 RepID=A0A812T1H2_9DINO|nr:zntD [Symbiodinium natans]
MLTIHSLLEGMSIGAQVHTATFVSIFLAVGAHKGLAAFALGSKLLEDAPPGQRWILYRGILLFGVCSPIGIMIGAYMVDEVKGAGIGLLLSAATGTFLYIAIPELLLPAFEGEQSSTSATLAAVLGFSVMAFLAIWV